MYRWNTTNLIRILVLAEVLLIFVGVGTSIGMEKHLDPLLQEYLVQDLESPRIFDSIYFMVFVFLILSCYVASVVGILLIKMWAKNWYIFSLALGCTATLFLGPTVEHAFAQSITDLGLLISGFVGALLLFSESAFSRLGSESKKTNQI